MLTMTSAFIFLALTIACAILAAEAPAPDPTPTVPPETFQRLGETEPFEGKAALALEQAVQAFSEARYQESLRGFLEAQRLHGEPSRVIHNWLGNSHSSLGHHRAAIRHFTAALELEDNSGNRVSRGTAYMETGDCRKATLDAEAALQLEAVTTQGVHTHAEAHVILANCNALEGDYQAALRHAEAARSIADGHGYPDDRLQAFRRPRESIRAALDGRVLPTDLLFGPPLDDPRHGERLAGLPWVEDGLANEEEEEVLQELLSLLVIGGLDMGKILDMPFLLDVCTHLGMLVYNGVDIRPHIPAYRIGLPSLGRDPERQPFQGIPLP